MNNLYDYIIFIPKIAASTIAPNHELSSSLYWNLSITYAEFPYKMIYLTHILIAYTYFNCKISYLDSRCWFCFPWIRISLSLQLNAVMSGLLSWLVKTSTSPLFSKSSAIKIYFEGKLLRRLLFIFYRTKV